MPTTPGRARITRPWPVVGIAAQLVFTIYWLIAPLWQGPHYSVLADSISDMYAVTAPAGALMVVVVTACGGGTLGWVLFGLRPRLRGTGWAGVGGCVLLGCSIFGLGDLLTPFERLACRMADPGCTAAAQLSNAGGRLDATLSTIGIVLLIAAGFTLASAFGATSTLAPAKIPTRVLSGALVVTFVLLAFGPDGYGGLIERLLALFGAVLISWPAATSLLNRSDRRRSAQSPLGRIE